MNFGTHHFLLVSFFLAVLELIGSSTEISGLPWLLSSCLLIGLLFYFLYTELAIVEPWAGPAYYYPIESLLQFWVLICCLEFVLGHILHSCTISSALEWISWFTILIVSFLFQWIFLGLGNLLKDSYPPLYLCRLSWFKYLKHWLYFISIVFTVY